MNVFDDLAEKAKQITNGAQILRDWIGDGGHVVDRELAQHRADICLECPKHSSGWGLLEMAADAIKQQVEIKNHLQIRVEREKQLHVCEICGCAMRLKVHLPIGRISLQDDEKALYPSTCWLLQESKCPT